MRLYTDIINGYFREYCSMIAVWIETVVLLILWLLGQKWSQSLKFWKGLVSRTNVTCAFICVSTWPSTKDAACRVIGAFLSYPLRLIGLICTNWICHFPDKNISIKACTRTCALDSARRHLRCSCSWSHPGQWRVSDALHVVFLRALSPLSCLTLSVTALCICLIYQFLVDCQQPAAANPSFSPQVRQGRASGHR